jgi:predicted Zn-dependent peptidase
MRANSMRTVLGLLYAVVVVTAAAPLAAQRTLDRSKPPAPGPAPTLHLPAIEKLKLSNGLPVWIVELHEVPVVQLNLVLSVGSTDDPPGKFGVASLAMAMLTEGAGSRSALEIADAVDFLGADLGAASGIDSSAVRLHVPAARLAAALPIMADVALRATFPPDELERLRDDRLTDLLQSRDDPPTIAALAFARVLYGTEHRYGTATVGTGKTIAAFTPDDLRAFYRSAMRPENATLLVVGDVTRGAVVPLLESAFGSWRADGPALERRPLPAAQERSAREVYIVDKPGAPQSQVRIGWVGVPRSTPDYFPIQVMNTILGGSFSSRLNMNLREQHGYTYGAGSSFDMRASPGPFSATAGVQTDKTSEALTEFFKELTAIGGTVPADELERAKNYVALRFPGGFETTADITRRLEDMLVYKLPDDYFAKYVRNIQAVTAADVRRVARKYVQTGRFAVVVAGDRATIEPGIRALSLGPIHELAIDDVFGPAPKIGGE